MFDNFYTDNIFSNGTYLTGTLRFTADLSIEKKRVCTTCLNYLDNNECSSMGKILYPDCPYCSRYKPKYIKRYKTKRCSVCGKVKSINKFIQIKKCRMVINIVVGDVRFYTAKSIKGIIIIRS